MGQTFPGYLPHSSFLGNDIFGLKVLYMYDPDSKDLRIDID